MLGMTRAVAVLVCLYPLVGAGYGQPRVDPRNSYERILLVLPVTGSGSPSDPIRPSLIPAPGNGPTILNITPAAPVSPATGVAATPIGIPNQILGYIWVLSDDGKFALTEIVMRDRSAFPAIMALPGVPAFIKGVHKLTDAQASFQQYKKDFDITKFGAWVR